MPRDDSHQIESWVETYLRKQCEAAGALVVKNQKRRGWPDRTIYWFFGVTDIVETKRPKGGVFEPLQLRTHEKLRARGHAVFIINTRSMVDDYVTERIQYGRLAARKAGIMSL